MADPMKWFSEYLDEVLDDDQVAELEAWIMASPANARQFMMHCSDHLHMRQYFRMRSITIPDDLNELVFDELLEADGDTNTDWLAALRMLEARAGEGQLTEWHPLPPVEMTDPRLSMHPTLRGFEEPLDENPKRVIIIPRWVANAALVAAMLTLSVLLWQLWPSRSSTPPQVVTQQLAIQCAVLEESADAVWIEKPASSVLRSGDTLVLASGEAKVRFIEDASVTLRGGTTLKITAPNRCDLTEGEIAGHAATELAQGFEVGVPGGLVKDLGTKFTVEVSDDGNSWVEVQEGLVAVSLASDGTKPQRSLHLIPGGIGRIIGDGSLVEVSYEVPLQLPNTGIGRANPVLTSPWAVTAINAEPVSPPAEEVIPARGDPNWPLDDANSKWIIQKHGGMKANPNQLTVFAVSFKLPENVVVDQLRVPARIWADDTIEDISLNHRPVGFTKRGLYEDDPYRHIAEPYVIELSEHFRAGENTIRLYVRNSDGGQGVTQPTGLRVAFDLVAMQVQDRITAP